MPEFRNAYENKRIEIVEFGNKDYSPLWPKNIDGLTLGGKTESVMNEIQNMEAKIDGVKSYWEKIKSNIDHIEKNLRTTDKRIDPITDQLKAVDQKIAPLIQQSEKTKNEFQALTGIIKKVEAELRNAKKAIAPIDSKIEAAKKPLVQQTREMSEKFSSMTSLITKVERELESAKKKIDPLLEKVEQLGPIDQKTKEASKRFSSINAMIEKIKVELAETKRSIAPITLQIKETGTKIDPLREQTRKLAGKIDPVIIKINQIDKSIENISEKVETIEDKQISLLKGQVKGLQEDLKSYKEELKKLDEIMSSLGSISEAISNFSHKKLTDISCDDHHSENHALRHITPDKDPIDGDKLSISWNPTHYSQNDSSKYVTSNQHLTAHLHGIDEAINLMSKRSIRPSGSAGGGLYGEYPNPEVKDDGHKHTIKTVLINHNEILKQTPDDHHKRLHYESHIRGGDDQIDGDKINIAWRPINYQPDTQPNQVNSQDHLTAHLKGIDNEMANIHLNAIFRSVKVTSESPSEVCSFIFPGTGNCNMSVWRVLAKPGDEKTQNKIMLYDVTNDKQISSIDIKPGIKKVIEASSTFSSLPKAEAVFELRAQGNVVVYSIAIR